MCAILSATPNSGTITLSSTQNPDPWNNPDINVGTTTPVAITITAVSGTFPTSGSPAAVQWPADLINAPAASVSTDGKTVTIIVSVALPSGGDSFTLSMYDSSGKLCTLSDPTIVPDNP